jgi:hypothetical protein
MMRNWSVSTAWLLAILALCVHGWGCGRMQVNKTLYAVVQESAWRVEPTTAPRQPLRLAIGQCFAKYLDRRFEGFNSPYLFDAYEACMRQNGFVPVGQSPLYR